MSFGILTIETGIFKIASVDFSTSMKTSTVLSEYFKLLASNKLSLTDSVKLNFKSVSSKS